jgi:hypothetical protein
MIPAIVIQMTAHEARRTRTDEGLGYKYGYSKSRRATITIDYT